MIGRTLSAIAVVFLLLQLARPELKDPPVTADLEAPVRIKQILKKACYPCHSNETRLSWFDKPVPAYQLVRHDVMRGRMVLNFSELEEKPVARRKAILFEAVSQIQMGAMPLPRYTALHPGANVTPAELAELRDYIIHSTSTAPPARLDVEAADNQYRKWITTRAIPFAVQTAPNGIEFISTYKNWNSISSTDRDDTNTLKVILGNDVAMKAISGHNINPWPDGTVLAKVSWMRQRDARGVTRTGSFEQVAFMMKDSVKYASTAGWGWAQWTGTDLKPYGADAEFARACVACHAPLRKNDYVFTAPIAFPGASQ